MYDNPQSTRRPRWIWLLPLLLIVLVLLVVCLFTVGPQRLGLFREAYPPAEFYVQDQLIVTGPRSAVDEVMGRLQERAQRISRVSFSDFTPQEQTCAGLPPETVTDVYHVSGPTPDVAALLRTIRDTPGGNTIQAGPNWLIGSPWEVGGSPWEVGGSPWEVGGSPWEVGGSGGDGEPRLAQKPLYMTQWALERINLRDRLSVDGRGVRVGVFDTSPLGTGETDALQLESITWVDQPQPFELWWINPAPVATLPASASPHSQPTNRSHGLFVASLIHRLAPGSRIELIRVLGDDNRGDLATLNRALHDFLMTVGKDDALGTVINLSLGVRVPPGAAGFNLPADVQSLEYMMKVARCLDVVVVAAAGNDSANLTAPADPQLPAVLDTVIGVAASNAFDERGCFSNRGDIAAPGGDGRGVGNQGEAVRVASAGGDAPCQPRLQLCQPDTTCAAGVAASVEQTPKGTGYAHWTGSSFAAPQVSGLAALIMQAGRGQFGAADVETILSQCATPANDPALGAGIIEVQRTLFDCVPKYAVQP